MIGTGEIIVILCVLLILFGGKKLPEFARSLGVGIREFKKAIQGDSSCTSCPKKCCQEEEIEPGDKSDER